MKILTLLKPALRPKFGLRKDYEATSLDVLSIVGNWWTKRFYEFNFVNTLFFILLIAKPERRIGMNLSM